MSFSPDMSPTVAAELETTLAAVRSCNLEVHDALYNPAVALSVLGYPFLNTELMPARMNDRLPSDFQRFADRVLQPALKHGSRKGEDNVLNLGHAVGRLIGAAVEADLITTFERPIQITDTQILMENFGFKPVIPNALKEIQDWGMSITGLTAHTDNLKADPTYRVTAIQKEPGDTAVIQGYAEYNDIGDNLTLISGGIARATAAMLKNESTPPSDLIIASRVHMAGTELRDGVIRGPRLLALGGVFIANGPTRYSKGFSYDKVRFEMQRTGKYDIGIDQIYPRQASNGLEENRIILGVKVKS
jgi:hypothetical protein